jgi:hypothetical protein
MLKTLLKASGPDTRISAMAAMAWAVAGAAMVSVWLFCIKMSANIQYKIGQFFYLCAPHYKTGYVSISK